MIACSNWRRPDRYGNNLNRGNIDLANAYIKPLNSSVVSAAKLIRLVCYVSCDVASVCAVRTLLHHGYIYCGDAQLVQLPNMDLACDLKMCAA